MNRVPGELSAGGTVAVLGGDVPVADARDAAPGPVDVLFRPEQLSLAAAAGGNGIVTSRTFLGAVTRLTVALDGDTEVRVDVPPQRAGRHAGGRRRRAGHRASRPGPRHAPPPGGREGRRGGRGRRLAR
jgi:putative spermidine/putrescine transport system ATP-binding protein